MTDSYSNTLYGLPQPLTGTELVTIMQQQNGQWALCTMPISQLAGILNSTAWSSTLSTIRPDTAGVLWNDGGVVSIS